MHSSTSVKTQQTIHLFSGLIMMLSLGVMYTWSLFRAPMLEKYPWSQSQLSMTFSIVTICFAIGGLISGRLGERLSRSTCLRIGATLCMLGYVGASVLPNNPSTALICFYLFYGVCTGIGIGISYNSIISNITAWFPGKSGVISGILLTAYGFSALIVGQIMQNQMAGGATVFQVFRRLGCFIFVVLVAGSFLLKPAPHFQMESDVIGINLPTRQMLKTFSFWTVFFWNLCISCAGLLIMNCAADITLFFGGTATMGMLLSVSNGASRSFVGALIDKAGYLIVVPLLSTIMLLASGVMLLSVKAGFLALILLGLLVCGVAFGGSIVSNATVIRQLFGSQYYSTNFAVLNLGGIPASIISGMLVGVLHPSADACYGAIFLAMCGFATISLMISLLLYKKR